jgi:pimeloyl-ACP methyl ester carboxylesterase
MTDAASANDPVTVVLVHGAFADGSGWNGVVERLQAAEQRPVAAAAFGEKNGRPAWKNRPAWAVVATGDKAAGADVVRSMAGRAKAEITEVDGSHVIMISQPQAVTDVIMKALQSVA